MTGEWGEGGSTWSSHQAVFVLLHSEKNDLISQGVCLCEFFVTLYNKVLHIPVTRKPIWVLSL